jgi:hypothetical protein
LTETVRGLQSSCASIEVLVVSVQSPGPRNGTSATLKAELSEPLSTPLETSSLGAGTVGLALEPVTAKYFVSFTVGAVLIFGLLFGATVVLVAVDGGVVVVVDVVVDVEVVVEVDVIAGRW